MIKTFRGVLADSEQEKIRLSTKKGKIGYRIFNFQLMPKNPGSQTNESTMKIYKVEQSSVDEVVDLSDHNILAAGFYVNTSSSGTASNTTTVIFEQEIFNQDIFITHTEKNGTEPCNYYLELETVNLSDNAAAVSTLRDIRLNPQVGA